MIAVPLLDSRRCPASARVGRGPGSRRRPSRTIPSDFSRAAVRAALDQGFVAAGVAAGPLSEGWTGFRAFLDGGLHGEMEFLERDSEARRSLDSILPYAKAALCVAREVPPGGAGNVARYARGEDYHDAVRRELKAVVASLRRMAPQGAHFRVCVDTAPVLEREWAVRAGLGFVGKNGMLIVPGVGSHVVLGEVLTDLALAPTATTWDGTWEKCGGCRACLDGCPTSAILAPRVVDARRCLSYLTIEKTQRLHAGRGIVAGGPDLRLRRLPGRLPVQLRASLPRERGGAARFARPGRARVARRLRL